MQEVKIPFYSLKIPFPFPFIAESSPPYHFHLGYLEYDSPQNQRNQSPEPPNKMQYLESGKYLKTDSLYLSFSKLRKCGVKSSANVFHLYIMCCFS